jgi:predicted enzyme related to lactoylglutathione lyase
VGEVERYPNGTFCWVELGTPDVDRAKAFYSGLLGWTIEEVASSDPGSYLIGRIGGKDVAGIHDHSQGGAHGWDSHIAVDDLEAALRRVADLGGDPEEDPHDIAGSGRVAGITDPGGAEVFLWQDAGFAGARLVNETGTWTWSDLSTREPEAVGTFYTELFGWEFRQIIPTYWGIGMGPYLIGGMRTMDEDPPGTVPSWTPYFVVADLDAAQASVAGLGGRVLGPPRAVPAGRFLVASDPAGAVVGLLEMGPEGPAGGVDRVNPTT